MLLTVLTSVAGAAAAVTGLVLSGEYTVQSIGTAAFFVIAALILVPVSLALGKGSPAARSVVVTWNLLLVLALVTLLPVFGWWSVPGAVAAVATLVCLALPSSRAHIRPRTLFQDDAQSARDSVEE